MGGSADALLPLYMIRLATALSAEMIKLLPYQFYCAGMGYAVLPNPLTVQPGLENGDVLALFRVSVEGVCAQNNEVGA